MLVYQRVPSILTCGKWAPIPNMSIDDFLPPWLRGFQVAKGGGECSLQMSEQPQPRKFVCGAVNLWFFQDLEEEKYWIAAIYCVLYVILCNIFISYTFNTSDQFDLELIGVTFILLNYKVWWTCTICSFTFAHFGINRPLPSLWTHKQSA